MDSSRQLAAIMFTDIVGYTLLMGTDEQKAFQIISQNRQLQKPIVEKYGGRWIKELGDGVMVSFSTVSDAIYAATEIQQQCRESCEFLLRIGIHHGEIVFDGNDVFGDAVNVASRIQAIAPVGGTYISESVHQNVINKADIQTKYVKAVKLKNVREPVRLYELITNSINQSTVFKEIPISEQKKPSYKYVRIGLSIFAVIAIYFSSSYFIKDPSTGFAGETEKSIAVLPFVNMSNDKEQEYFSDGLSEELLNLLSKVQGLKVIARTSSFAFKGKNEDIRTISDKLGVSHILEGSVRKSNNTIRISTILINANDGNRLWSHTYERQLDDIFKLQDEIAHAVVRELKLKLLKPASSFTRTSKAHNLILQGNFFHEKLDKENVEKSLQLYQKALQIDSLDAHAWAMVAKTYSRAAWQNYIPQRDGYARARTAVLKAISIEPENTDALLTLGGLKLYYDFKWNEAEDILLKVLKYEPANSAALNTLGALYQTLGDRNKAIKYTALALEYDPLRPIIYSNQGANYFYSGEYDKSNAMYKKALDINPEFQRAHMYMGRNYLFQNKPEVAMDEMQRENIILFKQFGLIMAYHALNDHKKSNELLQLFLVAYHKEWPYLLAQLYAYVGKKEEALIWLQQAYIQKDSWLIWIKEDPLLKTIWQEKKYTEILKKLNLK